jgi:CDP-diacylglycerol--glycerol-3-phosphate 3-phosphatidyltransferase
MLRSLPNILTFLRIIIIPFIVFVFYFFESDAKGRLLIALLFTTAAITDFLDGYFARILAVQSTLGKFFDPIADKLLVVSCLVILIHSNNADMLPALAIICREILVSGLREFLADIRVSIPVSRLAKIKTFFQMGAIFLLLLGNEGSGFYFTNHFGNLALWIAALLTIITGYIYLSSSLQHISSE